MNILADDQQTSSVSGVGSPDEELLLMRRAVDLVLDGVAAETRQAFWRVVGGEEDPADVAKALGMTVNAVYLAKSRIKRQIREEFEGLLESV